VRQIFLDSSALFTAVNSPTGGSAKLFTLKNFELITSPFVLAEVERNVRQKLENFHLKRFFLLVDKLKIVNQVPKLELINKAEQVIVDKDTIILAEAKQAACDFLITLDSKHFLTSKVSSFLKPQRVFTPKMFFKFFTRNGKALTPRR